MKNVFITTILLTLAVVAMGADTEISGFADAAYSWNPSDGNGQFGLDQVEIDVVHRAGDKSSVRVDLEWVKDGEDFLARVEQGFMTYTLRPDLEINFGKFNAPIGFELLDPTEMYQYSHALVFDYGLPTNLTGLSVARGFGSGFDVLGYVSNGWDANEMAGKNMTFGGRCGYAVGAFGGGLSAISGKQDLDPGTPLLGQVTRTVMDLDLSYASGRWLFGGEVNKGTATINGPTGMDHDWLGLMAMTHVDYTETVGLTLRYDFFDDADGWAFPAVGGEFQTMQSITLCPTFVLDENFGALVELRLDMSDQEGFMDKDGLPTDTNMTVAFEMTYGW